MSMLDVLAWVVGGLVAGTLAGAIWPNTAAATRSAVTLAGFLGALAGGGLAAGLSAMSAVSFLGAVCGAVLAAVPFAYLLWRSEVKRYHR